MRESTCWSEYSIDLLWVAKVQAERMRRLISNLAVRICQLVPYAGYRILHVYGPRLDKTWPRGYSLKLKIKRNDWLLADMGPQATNHCALF